MMPEKMGRGTNKPAHARKTIERVNALQAGQFNALSVEFAKLCVEARLSPAAIARVLNVTRGAVHRWMRGSKIREERRPAVQSLMDTIKQGLSSGELPKINRFESEKFVESLRSSAQ